MGSVSLKIGDGTARFKRASMCSSAVNFLMLFSVVTTNLFALYAFTYHPTTLHHHNYPKNISLISEKVSLILRQIESSQNKLSQMEKELLGYKSIDLSGLNIANELKEFLNHHQLPLGKDSRSGITEMVASVGHSSFSCFALENVSEKIYSWSGLGCKNLACLNSKKLNRDCAGCFDIVHGYETQKYVKARSKNDFLIDDVLAMGSGGIRIGFDIGGGSGTFAARMAERNVTVVTATLNVDAPFNEFIAARGLFPLYFSLDQRFPFHDNVFDLVHAANGLDVGGRPEKLEFLMFDIDRVLRAGGLLWLDNFYCSTDDKKRALTRLIERFGYKKLKWVVGEKINGSGKSEVYLSAVLQKPLDEPDNVKSSRAYLIFEQHFTPPEMDSSQK
ncbi:UNVERIFIED_CONTAM: hypothetical protein Sradi_3742000 [Sesamum radiatum]|uniref:S-adenosyl-L-methionine-dependent methyltransferase n=1 Tax=Sesamum radiatum TaxID=300843 RepID=A0AAW2PYK0_SESRA